MIGDRAPVLRGLHAVDHGAAAGAGQARQLITLQFDDERGKRYLLHPVHRASGATDRSAAELASYDAASGSFTVPARTAVVFVVE